MLFTWKEILKYYYYDYYYYYYFDPLINLRK